jgi:hypothetical protein
MDKAGKLVGQVGYRTRLLLLGVLIPGLLILLEISITVYVENYGLPSVDSMRILLQQISQANLVPATLITVFILIISFALGFVGRELTFAISNIWLRQGHWPCRALDAISGEINHLYSSDRVRKCSAYILYSISLTDIL